MKKIFYYDKKEKNLHRIIFFMFLVFIGMTCNFLVMTNNEGKMPVYNYNVDSDSHKGFTDLNEVKYSYLSDFNLFGRNYTSIGDYLMFLGMFGMVLFACLYYKLKWKECGNE